MKNNVSKMRDHTIVCGYGRTGKVVAEELQEGGFPFVLVELDHGFAEELDETGMLYILGDSTEESVLEEAGIGRYGIQPGGIRLSGGERYVDRDGQKRGTRKTRRGLSNDVDGYKNAIHPTQRSEPRHIETSHSSSSRQQSALVDPCPTLSTAQ